MYCNKSTVWTRSLLSITVRCPRGDVDSPSAVEPKNKMCVDQTRLENIYIVNVVADMSIMFE